MSQEWLFLRVLSEISKVLLLIKRLEEHKDVKTAASQRICQIGVT